MAAVAQMLSLSLAERGMDSRFLDSRPLLCCSGELLSPYGGDALCDLGLHCHSRCKSMRHSRPRSSPPETYGRRPRLVAVRKV
jgi:hypothetical protein